MTQHKINYRNLPWTEPEQFLISWPSDAPLLYLGGDSEICYLATSFYEISFSGFSSLRIDDLFKPNPFSSRSVEFLNGYWGLLSFEAYAQPFAIKHQSLNPKIYRVSQALIFNKKLKTIKHSDYKPCPLRLTPLSGTYHFSLDALEKMSQIPRNSTEDFKKPEIKLLPEQSDQHYLNLCQKILEDIRNGRFYQINLLRYFHTNQALKRSDLISMIHKNGGPYSALWDLPGYCIASMSPEKFVDMSTNSKRTVIQTYPIKGTLHRSPHLSEDLALKETLRKSPKDNAELHMIVDLMRNDLNRVCETGSVQVLDPGTPRSFKTVHHLVAHLKGFLKADLNWNELFSRLCPGGSITGAPKKEVLNAISEYEQRSRGYFMGNIFFLDDSGQFNSSILIRTLFTRKSSHILNEIFQYAAGSGITLKSNPYDELNETETKCKPVTHRE